MLLKIFVYVLLPLPSSSEFHLTRNQGTYLLSSEVHTATLSIAKEQQFLQLLTIKPSYNMLVECSEEPPWTQASSHLTVTEQCPEETNQEGEGLCHSTDHIWEAQLARIFKILKAKINATCVSDFPRMYQFLLSSDSRKDHNVSINWGFPSA